MKKNFPIAFGVITLAIVLLAVAPFLIPVPPLDDTVPVLALADPDSLFVEVNGIQVHYKTAGTGERTFILLHGFGASQYSWREVVDPLSTLGKVVAYDRPAFGLTERPLDWEEGMNPYSPESQVALLIGLMDHLEIPQAILIGNSAGGTVALNTAVSYPDRVEALVLVDAAVYQGGGAPSWMRPALNLPQLDHLGPLLARRIAVRGDEFIYSAWSDPSLVTAEILSEYRKPLQAENWDRALWELTKVSRQSSLPEQLAGVHIPALVISGADDQIVPVELSQRLAEDLPRASLAVFPNCGHLPQEECPDAFMEAVTDFLRSRSEE